jgi:hypothetical protein
MVHPAVLVYQWQIYLGPAGRKALLPVGKGVFWLTRPEAVCACQQIYLVPSHQNPQGIRRIGQNKV